MSKRTAGKWTYVGDVIVGVVGDCDCDPAEVPEGEVVVYSTTRHGSHGIVVSIGEDDFDALYCEEGLTWEQYKANCRLIAAAPDLLDACMIALHYVENSPRRWSNENRNLARTLSDAIEKAIEIKEGP